jgi:hypothetical protein
MTDVVTTTAPLDEVRGLVDERGRYEGWLSALDARRAVTPAHVLERVRGDYEGRLRRVLESLTGHVPALHADERALAGHHDDRMRVLGERRDALAEVELRTLVGEFPADEGERQRREVEGEITALEGDLAGATTRLAELRALLERVSPAPAPGDAPPEQAASGDAPGVSATPAAAFGATPATPTPPTPTLGQAFSAPYTAPYATPPGGSPAYGTTSGDPLGLDAARAALGDSRGTPPFAGQSFADAAFRTPTSTAQVTPPGGVAQEKTLRCPDCGAMNYPTEWYCEKCGGELAAL